MFITPSAVPISHPLASKDKLKIKDLYNQKLLLLKPGSMNVVDRLRWILNI